MAFPTLRSYSAGSEGTNTTAWDVNYPGPSPPTGQTSAITDGGGTWFAAGDLMLLLIGCDGSTRSFSNFATGWTVLKGALTDGTASFNAWYRIADGAESQNGQIWNTGTGITCSGSEQGPWRISVYKNFYGAGGVIVSTGATGSDAAPDPDSLTLTWGSGVDTRVIAAMASDGSVTVSTYPSGYTLNQYADHSGGGAGAGLGQAGANVTTSPENPGAFGLSGTDGWAAATIGIRGVADAYQPRYGFTNFQNPGVF